MEDMFTWMIFLCISIAIVIGIMLLVTVYEFIRKRVQQKEPYVMKSNPTHESAVIKPERKFEATILERLSDKETLKKIHEINKIKN